MKVTGILDVYELTPLQRFQLGQLKLVAVIYDTRYPRAVVEDEAGLGYILQIGTPIGPNNGAVKAIEPQECVPRSRDQVRVSFQPAQEEG